MYPWPPRVDDVKNDQQIALDDHRDDARIAESLDAAIADVTLWKAEAYNVHLSPTSTLPLPTAQITLGTVRLAVRYLTRGRSPDGLIVNGEFGTTRIPSFDIDIERPLRIGRFAPAVLA